MQWGAVLGAASMALWLPKQGHSGLHPTRHEVGPCLWGWAVSPQLPSLYLPHTGV